ncbi:MAG: putative glycosyltransferase [Phormidesmis priestleyi Ana]|uniref:Putative glycosyltransferase n=1 Tax=Phormidesmis priestleyi Ana TaxID=1666911 RepID=A0A0P8BTJ4_9CYAN|nr:MAG: putative glycosyltransferase [Phormidesmis priestleyi Ana]
MASMQPAATAAIASLNSVQGPIKSPVSFSIIIETENLASADLPGLFCSLDALESQTLSPLSAAEVLMVETGDVPPELLDTIRAQYPWVTICRIDAGLEYYQAKMRGIGLTTGEVVVLCDSDCVYNAEWLESMLRPFSPDSADNLASYDSVRDRSSSHDSAGNDSASDRTVIAPRPHAVQMVAGETSLAITGPYGLAMALSYIFPRYTGCDRPQPTGGYFCNNVAFRRSLLTEFPIPGEMPLYRGNCVIHAKQLLANHQVIWQQPLARALHAPPNGLSHFVSRFFMLGYDALCVSRFANLPIAADPKAAVNAEQAAPLRPLRDFAVAGMILVGQVKTLAQRLVQILREDIRYARYLPLALPISLAALALYTVGLGVAYVRPAYWLNHRESLEALLEHS